MTDSSFLATYWLSTPENLKRWREWWSLGELAKGEEYIGIAFKAEVDAFMGNNENNLQISKKQYTYSIR
jgi:hypothetical protein